MMTYDKRLMLIKLKLQKSSIKQTPAFHQKKTIFFCKIDEFCSLPPQYKGKATEPEPHQNNAVPHIRSDW
jgi:hypothetical protein